MTECHSSSCNDNKNTTKRNCPACGRECLNVLQKTMLHHIRQPWTHKLTGQLYFYCSTPGCNIVYFADQSTIINQADIRTRIGVKEASSDSLICYCFGVSNAAARLDSNIKKYVIEQTKASVCACDIANPSGRCCLKDFPKTITSVNDRREN